MVFKPIFIFLGAIISIAAYADP
ncbi:MAG: hypothetical protein RL392_1635, partial [Pseudomonadota bacterium]